MGTGLGTPWADRAAPGARRHPSRPATVVAAAGGLLAGMLAGLVPSPGANASGVAKVSIGDVTVVEGDRGTVLLKFPIHMSQIFATETRIAWHTVDGSATAPIDYTSKSGTALIKPQGAVAYANIAVNGDALREANQTFTVRLTSAVTGTGIAVTVSRRTGTGTILDDDPTSGATVSVGDVTAVEGDIGRITYKFPIRLSRPVATTTIVRWSTADGSALAAKDYTKKTDIRAEIPAGGTATYANVLVNADALVEPTERFGLRITRAITGTTTAVPISRATGTGTILTDD